ncbi:hypothetical protein L1987_14401 [Smallanthus sonchifolius]|uniref:Uncharacterized protein n=1 Tax=Smallanthus sonchifolius TaxID=185202 RepID=A0ACB9J3R8_9ASTR|nr:hypothetical protein L1987_14401 [Smallanthus sonchifolius]
MSTPPISPVAQEPDVPTIPFPNPKRRWLSPIDDTIVYDEPFHVRVGGNMQDWEWYPSMIRSWVRQEHVPPPYFAATTSTIQTLPPLPYHMEQALAAFVAAMDQEIRNMRDAVGEITGLLERESQANEKIEKLTAELADTDHYHENLVTSFHEMGARVNTLEINLDVAQTRIEQLEPQLEAAIAAGDAQDVESEEEPAEDEDDRSTISSASSGI